MGKVKILLIVLALFAVNTVLNAQILKPAKWSYGVSKEQLKVGDEVDLIFQVTVDDGWHIFSSDFECEVGPIVTSFDYEKTDSYQLIGGLKAINPSKKYDEIFECEYTYFNRKGEFRQKIKILKPNPKIKITSEYQVCTDADGTCIALDEEYTFNLKAAATVVKTENVERPTNTEIEEVITVTTPDVDTLNTQEGSAIATVAPANKVVDKKSGVVAYEPFFDGDYKKKEVSYWWFMILAFVGGLAALLTPCVFPMIPMTVAFFTGQGKTGGTFKALFYGFSIILIYTIIGAAVSAAFGPSFANWLSTHWLPNLIFFVVFIVFAISFFGLFEITLPSSMVNKVDKQADKGGLLGIFFMAFTLVLVSFSCTGAIVGTILVEAASGQVLKPVLGMFAFSLAFAIPFTLFAIFPKWLDNLPKSGGWLNSVKVVLGFLELALAFKFLSIADQAFHWNSLDREVNIAIWIVIFTLMGFYLLGKIKLPHDSDLPHISVLRLLLATMVFTFVMYLIPGMFGAPLKALAGYLPPMHTHDFNIPGLIRDSQDEGKNITAIENCEKPKYEELLHLPLGLQGYFDYDQALACAKAQNKPLFIDFTGHGCTNCREMEAAVWSDDQVLKKLKNNFVIVALYVDDKTELPEREWYVSAYDNKTKKTIGKQNADFQIQRAKANAQPNYFIVGQDGKALLEPISYSDVEEFSAFLDKGLRDYNKIYLKAEEK